MKAQLLYILSFILLLSCTKGEEDPIISFRSRDKKIIGTWNWTQTQDITADSSVAASPALPRQLNIFDNGTYAGFVTNFAIITGQDSLSGTTTWEGEWQLENDKQTLILTNSYLLDPNQNYNPNEFEIIRLTNKEMILLNRQVPHNGSENKELRIYWEKE